jgi:multiple sugar transport system permease protein
VADHLYRLPRRSLERRWSLIAANVWRGIPFVAICLLAGLQTISPSLYEAAMIDGANPWQRFWHITFPMLMPILAWC